MKPGFDELKTYVIDRGLCTGCGTCIGVCPTEGLGFIWEDGEPLPTRNGECIQCGACFEACPGADVPVPEIEKLLFRKTRPDRSEDLGVFRDCFRAWAVDQTVRNAGSSGGVLTALAVCALEKGLIDSAIVAGYSQAEPWQAVPFLATTPEQIKAAANGKYTMVGTNSLLNSAVRQGFKRIGVVGMPCVIHGLRKMQLRRIRSDITRKIALQLGLLCGAEFCFEGTRHLLTEFCDIDDFSQIKSLGYRVGKYPGTFVVELKSGEKRQLERSQFLWGVLMHFKRDRCEMCLDWSSELADVSVGDYWYPASQPGEDERRSSVMVRSSTGEGLFNLAKDSGYIGAEPIAHSEIVSSGMGFEVKKHAAAFKLLQRQRFGWPAPNFHYRPRYEPFRRAVPTNTRCLATPAVKDR